MEIILKFLIKITAIANRELSKFSPRSLRRLKYRTMHISINASAFLFKAIVSKIAAHKQSMNCINSPMQALTFEHSPLERQFVAGKRESLVRRSSFNKLGFLIYH